MLVNAHEAARLADHTNMRYRGAGSISTRSDACGRALRPRSRGLDIGPGRSGPGLRCSPPTVRPQVLQLSPGGLLEDGVSLVPHAVTGAFQRKPPRRSRLTSQSAEISTPRCSRSQSHRAGVLQVIPTAAETSSSSASAARPFGPKRLGRANRGAEIREIHTGHKGTYGVQRVHAELRGFGRTVNRKRVERLIRKHGLQALHLQRRKRTTPPTGSHHRPPDLVKRRFSAGHLDEKCGCTPRAAGCHGSAPATSAGHTGRDADPQSGRRGGSWA
ncbi:IS3 family transposase [Streptomyces platensis]|uniref:IS3 family transposase n=1 Tax=Streptomyces platensis TaxID=58346 RepID=UPI00386DC5A9